MSIKSRSYLVDVSRYQPVSMSAYKRAGAVGVIVQTSVSNSFRAPKAAAQVASAKHNNMAVLGYFYACFGNSASQAQREAVYAVHAARAQGIPKGSFLGVDWEGQDNYTGGSIESNTGAVMEAMHAIKARGYKPLAYSSASFFNSKLDVRRIVRTYPNSIWVASYATMGIINVPNFGYFPSMPGVLIWQFTDNWHGLNVDGNITLLDMNPGKTVRKHVFRARRVPKNKRHGWDKRKGVFTLGQTLRLHTSPLVSAMTIAKLHKGQQVVFNGTLQGVERLWLRQPRGLHRFGYIAATDRYGHKTGSIKYAK